MKLITRDNMGKSSCVLKFKKPNGIIRFRIPKTIKVKKSNFFITSFFICLGLLLIIF